MNRPRGLCWACYYTPGVLELYPVGSADPATAKYVPYAFRPDDELSDEELAVRIAEARRRKAEACGAEIDVDGQARPAAGGGDGG